MNNLDIFHGETVANTIVSITIIITNDSAE